MGKLLSIDTNAKTVKGQKYGYMTAILYLTPSDLSGMANLCAYASAGCRAACLYTAGRGRMKSVSDARLKKTKLFIEDRPAFMEQIVKEIEAFIKRAKKNDLIPVVRLNGTSDIPWENVKYEGKCVMEHFPDVQFYDYTKNPNRKALPSNYHLTFSLAEDNDKAAKAALRNGINVAAVFHDKPETFMGRTVIDGDASDLRFNDPANVIVGLTAKGDAKHDTTGFVR